MLWLLEKVQDSSWSVSKISTCYILFRYNKIVEDMKELTFLWLPNRYRSTVSFRDWEAWSDLNLEHGKLFAGTLLGSMEVLVRCFYTLETTTNCRWNSFCQATD
ncbi:uncharacterized protein LOC118481130 [Helianthus annuus]|uniref:uncharacterized protein LOC118481130 n=1 Tax=Helianthus annuus TaxID=4232 RepID=UPI0016532D1C|nr:uncharacterized protein LOC118481130 [Helianthus annuus]